MRLVLEKPLGHDLASNREINSAVRKVLSEQQVFRIDHYLGKPSVQNLFAMRFGNALFEPIWRREYIANIQITIAEDLGVEKRGAFYDQTGALRDMVQNHALQLVCAIGMEPPINAHADAIRDEKLKVLRALKPWTAESIGMHAIRGQYAAGTRLRRAGPGLPRGARRRPREPHRDLRRAAHRDRQLALGRRAVLHPHRQAAGVRATPASRSTSGQTPHANPIRVRRLAEVDLDAGVARTQPLAGADVERHAGPAPVGDLGAQRNEGLGAALGVDAGLVAVALERARRRRCRPCTGRGSRASRSIRRSRA